MDKQAITEEAELRQKFRDAFKEGGIYCGRSVKKHPANGCELVQGHDRFGPRVIGAWLDVKIYVSADEAGITKKGG